MVALRLEHTRSRLAIATLIGLAGAAAAPGRGQAATVRVPADATSITAAMALAGTGDTVLVAPGTWAERVVLRSGVTLRGEGAPGAAVIDAGMGGACVDAIDGGSFTRLEGFRLVHGSGSADGGASVGGALRVLGGSLRITDCTFEDSQATFGGGSAGIGAQVTFRRCAWIAGVAGFGGGHFQSGGQATMTDVTFEDGRATAGGSLFVTNGAQVGVQGGAVRRSISTGDGAGVRIDGSVVTLSNFRAEDNQAGGRGGALAVAAGGQVIVSFSTFLRNGSGGGGGAFHVSCEASAPSFQGQAAVDCALLSMTNVDILRSTGTAPAAGAVTGSAVVHLDASIVVGNASGLACLDSRSTLDVMCSNLYANGGPDLEGNCSPAVDPNNRAVDPFLCDLAAGDVGLCANSPLANPGCGDTVWGSGGVRCSDCGPTPARSTTWGRVKVRYH